MPTPEQVKQWRVTSALLQRARRAIQDSSEQFAKFAKEFDEYIQHNELELAMDMLQEMSELASCRGGFWRDLERAAKTMGLEHRAKYFRSRFMGTQPLS